MRFEKRYQPWLACSKDKSRPVLCAVNLTINTIDGERVGFLDASNSYVMVRVPCELHADDTPGLILPAALKHAARTAAKGSLPEIACVARKCETQDGYAWPRPDGAFPDFDRISASHTDNKSVVEFGVNGDFLAAVSKALGARNGVGMSVGSVLRPLNVRVSGDDEAKGIVMPIRLHS